MAKGTGNGPLEGYRVLELSSTVAGPFCGRLLAGFGAEVIKIEPPEGDPLRSMGKQWEGKSLYAASILRNKKLVAIDLRKPGGQEAVRKLAEQCDIVVENFRPGTLERWGIGWTELSKTNRRLVMVRISGYGQDGPLQDRPGYGVTAEAMSGLRYITGDPDRPPARVAVSLTDYITGLYAAFGAVMAILVREQTGEGQCIDAALYESAFSFMEPHIPAFDRLGVVAKRSGSRLADHRPNALYPTRDGSFLHITAATPSLFRRLAEAMDRDDLVSDERFGSPRLRARNGAELDEIIAEWTSRHDREPLERTLVEAQIPASRIYTVEDIFADEQFKNRGMLQMVEDGDYGPLTVTGVVPKLSKTPGRIRHLGSTIGRDTLDVLRQIAGFDESQISRLEDERTIVCGSPVTACPVSSDTGNTFAEARSD